MDNQIQDNLDVKREPIPVRDGKPYFMGEEALIRFSSGEEGFGPDTFWLVDKENHTVRPFESHMALDSVFGNELKSALENMVTISPPNIDSSGDITDGVLSGFTLLGPEYTIKDDGSSMQMHFSPHQLSGRYGKPVNESVEQLATEIVDGLMGLLKTNTHKTGIPESFISKLKEDDKLMAFYISALAYGNYTLEDVFADISMRYHQSK